MTKSFNAIFEEVSLDKVPRTNTRKAKKKPVIIRIPKITKLSKLKVSQVFNIFQNTYKNSHSVSSHASYHCLIKTMLGGPICLDTSRNLDLDCRDPQAE
jgi:hypothetical protein